MFVDQVDHQGERGGAGRSERPPQAAAPGTRPPQWHTQGERRTSVSIKYKYYTLHKCVSSLRILIITVFKSA